MLPCFLPVFYLPSRYQSHRSQMANCFCTHVGYSKITSTPDSCDLLPTSHLQSRMRLGAGLLRAVPIRTPLGLGPDVSPAPWTEFLDPRKSTSSLRHTWMKGTGELLLPQSLRACGCKAFRPVLISCYYFTKKLDCSPKS